MTSRQNSPRPCRRRTSPSSPGTCSRCSTSAQRPYSRTPALASTTSLSTPVFRDPGISVPLLRAGFVQFGRPATGSYDPVCFDLNRNSKDGECPVVRLDHEVALMQERVQVVADLSDSFWSL